MNRKLWLLMALLLFVPAAIQAAGAVLNDEEISACGRAIFGTNGAFEQKIHGRTLWKNRIHVHSTLSDQFLHQLMRLLRLPRFQQDETHHSHGRRDGKGIRSHKENRTL